MKKVVLAFSFITTGLTAKHAVTRVDYALASQDSQEAGIEYVTGFRDAQLSPDDLIDTAAVDYNRKAFDYVLPTEAQNKSLLPATEAYTELMEMLYNKYLQGAEVRVLLYSSQFALAKWDEFLYTPFKALDLAEHQEATAFNEEPIETPLKVVDVQTFAFDKDSVVYNGKGSLNQVWKKSMQIKGGESAQAQKILELYSYIQNNPQRG